MSRNRCRAWRGVLRTRRSNTALEQLLSFQCDTPGIRLDVFAAAASGLTRSRIAALIVDGAISINGRTATKAGEKLSSGDDVLVRVPPPAPSHAQAEALPLSVLYEDADILVIEKPVGLVVHPAAGHETGTLVNALLHHCADLSGIGGDIRPGIVHRLDKDTSGALVVAKHDEAHVALSSAFAEGSVMRLYIAQAAGFFPPAGSKGVIDASIGRHPKHRQRMAVVPDGRRAVTRWQSLYAMHDSTLVACSLVTGRTHQIRVHMASINHPIVGDPVYGSGRPGSTQHLHGWQLAFDHPRTHERMRFATPLPEWVPPQEKWITHLTLDQDE